MILGLLDIIVADAAEAAAVPPSPQPVPTARPTARRTRLGFNFDPIQSKLIALACHSGGVTPD